MKILLIRRDNIGDLILTTPLIKTLGQYHQVDILVNSYNQAVLENNPYVHRVYFYTKLSHRRKNQSALKIIFQRLKTILTMRQEKYDVAIIVKEHWHSRALHWAKLSCAKRIIAMGQNIPSCVTDPLPDLSHQKAHIVDILKTLANPLGIDEAPGPLELFLSEQEKKEFAKIYPLNVNLPIYGLQISARRMQQRWPAENFIQFAQKIAQEPCQIVLFWSPGKSDHPDHPGDDEKAQDILKACENLNISIQAIPTQNIRELMLAMSMCDQILTSDGGALHIAVGVKTPVLALFGSPDSYHWAPWQIDHRLIDGQEQDVKNISVDLAYEQFIELRQEVLNKKSARL